MYNQIGHFAAAAEGICEALFLAGVTRRFPTLKFAFKEGGVGWALSLYCVLPHNIPIHQGGTERAIRVLRVLL
jgi:hypothetical protein